MTIRIDTRVSRLIKDECANYDNPTGLCLPLDCQCVQLNSMVSLRECGYLSCNWFRNAVLPLDKELTVLINNRTQAVERLCAVCRKSFIQTGRRQKYCTACAGTIRKQQESKRMREYRMKKAG